MKYRFELYRIPLLLLDAEGLKKRIPDKFGAKLSGPMMRVAHRGNGEESRKMPKRTTNTAGQVGKSLAWDHPHLSDAIRNLSLNCQTHLLNSFFFMSSSIFQSHLSRNENVSFTELNGSNEWVQVVTSS